MPPSNEKKEGILPSTTSVVAPSALRLTTLERLKANYRSHRKFLLILITYLAVRVVYEGYNWVDAFGIGDNGPRCPQADTLTPDKNANLWAELNKKIGTPAFETSAINWLAGAVRVPTESFDDMGPIAEDSRWDAFAPFHEYLLAVFPLVHANLKLTKVNTYGLYYEWKGSDATLKPLLLAAHQDVVPVDPTTVDQWTHPPYSGYFDGKRIWGRGSSDDKSGLIGILSTIETLLEFKFQPTRTVVLSFGFDEEASGLQGAGKLGSYLENVYGENGFAMIVDEGGSGLTQQFGSIIAAPGIAEKGYIDVLVEVKTPGGHSSIPPAHTSIGILSALLVHYEKHPYKVNIGTDEPVYEALQCIAEHAKSVPSDLRTIIKRSAQSKKALRALQAVVRKDKDLNSLVGTTQAIDIIHGGVKSNALPERAWAIVNQRIAVVSSLEEVKAHNTALLTSLSKKFNLTYNAFGSRISEEGAPASGSLTLSDAYNGGLEPAPVTPTGKDAAPYQLLSGTIKATYNIHRSRADNDEPVIVAPSILSGNTDTVSYWKLSQHIFRYNHQNTSDGTNSLGGMHTVNEFQDVDGFLEMIRFFTTLILNADESTSL